MVVRSVVARLSGEQMGHGLFWLVLVLAVPLLAVPPHHLLTRVVPAGLPLEEWLRLCLLGSRGGADWMVTASVVLLGAGGLRAGRRVWRSLWPAGGPHLHALPEDGAAVRRVRELARRFGLRATVRVVVSPRPIALTRGWWRPTVWLSDRLVERLSDDELAAVLIHEESHAANRDPLRTFLLRTLADALFFLPLLRRAVQAYEQRRELEADALAIRLQRDWRPLGSALLKLLAAAGVAGAARGVAFASALDLRVRRLLGEEVPRLSRLRLRLLADATASAPAAWILLCATWCMGAMA